MRKEEKRQALLLKGKGYQARTDRVLAEPEESAKDKKEWISMGPIPKDGKSSGTNHKVIVASPVKQRD